MPQKSSGRKLTSSKSLQFHQMVNTKLQRSKLPANDQRVLILSTPIKLKDGTVNIEQRAIPLRINNNNQLMMTGMPKNNVISLKRSNEPPPLALPINQLNKKSPTFVKNEVGQVLGKLIPLGKFSNIAPSPLKPRPPVSTSPILTNKNFRSDISKQTIKPRETKTLKLLDGTRRNTRGNDSLGVRQISKSKPKSIRGITLKPVSNVNGAAAITPNVMGLKGNTVQKHLTTVTSKPKKQVHLVLKGDNNMASIGQTGTNIKLIPLDQWKVGAKLNLLKTAGNASSTPKMTTVRKYVRYDGPGKTNKTSCFDEPKLQCTIKQEDFSITDVLDKDPLNIESLSTEEITIKCEPEQKCEIKIKQEAKTMPEVMDISSDYSISQCAETKPSNLVTAINGCKTVRLKVNNEYEINSHWLQEKMRLPKKENHNDLTTNVVSNTWSINSSADNTTGVTEEKSVVQKVDSYAELCKQFNINKSEVTSKEFAMMSYIHNLRRKLSLCRSSKVRMIRTLEQRQNQGMAYLTGIQRCFIKSQLRNSGKTPKRQRFTKLDISVAQEIFKATGPDGYNNLRKLFHLPSNIITINT